MNFLKLAESRYTTKTYNRNQKIDEHQINELKDILRLSPSSINSQPWRFTFVSNENRKKDFALASNWNSERIQEASHLVIFQVIDDISIFEQQISEYLPEAAVNYYHHYVKPLDEMSIKSWLKQQVYLSLGFFLAACASMGIDSTPMEGILTEKYDDLLQKEGYKTLFAVAIGYRNPADANQPATQPKSRIPKEILIETEA